MNIEALGQRPSQPNGVHGRPAEALRAADARPDDLWKVETHRQEYASIMSALWQSLFTLAGVVVGIAGTYLVQARIDRVKWQHERDVRWDVHRMETYARYGNAVKRVIMLASRLGDHRVLNGALDPVPVEDLKVQLAAAQIARAELWEEVRLLGDPATVAAARRWHRSSWELDRFARGGKSGVHAWLAAKGEARDAREEFHRAARADLGVLGELPAGPEDDNVIDLDIAS